MRIIFVSLLIPIVARRLAHAPAAALKAPREPPTFQD
jgi:hypothetical protein